MPEYEDLTFLDPDAVPSPDVGLEAVKARGRRKTRNRRLAATAPVALALAALVAVAVVVPGSSRSGQRVTPTAPTSTAPAASPTPTASDGTPTTAGPDVTNVRMTDPVRAELLQAYETLRGLQPGELTGFAPGTLYYAHVAATDTYWALGTVQAAGTASPQTSVDLQDGEATAAFHRTGSTGDWHAVLVGIPAICPGLVPDAVLLAWTMHLNTTACAGAPIGLTIQEGSGPGAVPSQEYVTEEGSLLQPIAVDAGDTTLRVTAGEQRFVVHAADYRAASVTTNGVTASTTCTLPAGSDGRVVPPLTTVSIGLSCLLPDRPSGDGTSLRFSYAPGGVVLGEWNGA